MEDEKFGSLLQMQLYSASKKFITPFAHGAQFSPEKACVKNLEQILDRVFYWEQTIIVKVNHRLQFEWKLTIKPDLNEISLEWTPKIKLFMNKALEIYKFEVNECDVARLNLLVRLRLFAFKKEPIPITDSDKIVKKNAKNFEKDAEYQVDKKMFEKIYESCLKKTAREIEAMPKIQIQKIEI